MPAVTDDGEIPQKHTKNKNTCRWPGFISWDVWALTLYWMVQYMLEQRTTPHFTVGCRYKFRNGRQTSKSFATQSPLHWVLMLIRTRSRSEHAPHINHETCPFLFFLSFVRLYQPHLSDIRAHRCVFVSFLVSRPYGLLE